MSTSDNDKSLHGVLLNMLEWFHNLCKEHNLRYYCIGGTMLGIVRHQGFIPWDDDIDVGMPRKDYEKLRDLASSFCDGRYVIEFPHEKNKDYPYLFMKVYDRTTTLIERSRFNIKRGVYIDIFPLDGIGNDSREAMKNFRPICILKKVHSSLICSISNSMSFFKKAIIILARLLSPLIISERRINNLIDKKCRLLDFDDSMYVGALLGAWDYKEIMPRSYIGEPTEYKFENLKVYGVENPHQYLTTMYGNYMELPPIEKRVSHHDYIERDFHKPYSS